MLRAPEMSGSLSTRTLKPAQDFKVSGTTLATKSTDEMTVADLLTLRGEIDRALPAVALRDLNLETELVLQFMHVKELQAQVMESDGVPANQLAQVASQVTSTLQALVKMQTDVGRDEQLKRIEDALLEAVSTLPDDEREEFFNRYEKIAARKGATD
jgi:hypothetical protein